MSTTVNTERSFSDFFAQTPNAPSPNYDHVPSSETVKKLAKHDLTKCSFESELVKSHRKVIATRRIVAGLAYYAYFLLALQCTLNLAAGNNTVTQTVISSVALFAVVLFAGTEIYADTMTNHMSMTSIMGEMVARLFSRGYNAIHLFDSSWGKTRNRHLSESFRFSMSGDRDALVYLYASDDSQNSYMKMTYAIASPVASSMWSSLFPNLCKGFSVPFNGGVVHSLHTVSMGTSYAPIASIDFTINRDSMVSGVLKTVWSSISGSIMASSMSLFELTTNSVKDTKNNKVSNAEINVSCKRGDNIADMGVISFQSSEINVSFNYDRTLGILKLGDSKNHDNSMFETTAG